MKTKRKWNVGLLAVAIAVFILSLPVGAEESQKGLSWYCVHAKDHLQPKADAGLKFVETKGGYYIDHRHVTQEDPDKVLYLTFDAGYENGNVAKVLDTLKEEKVPAAFFILGHLIEKNPELVKRMAEEGHTIGNHTVHHKNMSGASEEAFLEELRALELIYSREIGGELSRYYRPPEGCFSAKNMESARKNGYKTIFWSFAYPDWDSTKLMPTDLAKRIILENLHNGEVMLLHPTSNVNAAILGDVIREAKAQGYRFGTLDELTEETNVP